MWNAALISLFDAFRLFVLLIKFGGEMFLCVTALKRFELFCRGVPIREVIVDLVHDLLRSLVSKRMMT